jgi:multidrug transporter EmrE-like cation transporter
MPALALSVIAGVLFGNVMKLASQRGANLYAVAAWNYLVATLVCSLFMLVQRPEGHLLFTVVTGLAGGVCYFVSLVYYVLAMARLGVGLATATLRLSVALPVAAALVIWHESLQPPQIAGLLLVAAALPLLGGGSHLSARAGLSLLYGLLLPLFLINGLGQLANRVFTGGAPAADAYLFLASLFAGACVSAMVAVMRSPEPVQAQDWYLGALLGLVNVGSNVFLQQALRDLPSAEVFAIASASGVLLSVLTGVLVWHERLHRLPAVGVGLATIAVVLLTR